MFELLGVMAPVLFLAFWILSAVVDRKWRFGKNFISDLGVSEVRNARYLFDIGCVLCGILFAVFCAESLLTDNLDIMEIPLFALGIIVGILFLLIGLVNENRRPYHRYIALSMFSLGLVFLVMLLMNDIRLEEYLLAAAIVVSISATAISKLVSTWQMTECVGALSLLILIAVHFV